MTKGARNLVISNPHILRSTRSPEHDLTVDYMSDLKPKLNIALSPPSARSVMGRMNLHSPCPLWSMRQYSILRYFALRYWRSVGGQAFGCIT
jgi:hypothetical protein